MTRHPTTDPSCTASSSDTVPEPDHVRNAPAIPEDCTIAIVRGSHTVTELLPRRSIKALLSTAVNTADFVPHTVVSARASGTEMVAESWAVSAGYPVAHFAATWTDTSRDGATSVSGATSEYDTQADHHRNEQMVTYTATRSDRGVVLALLAYDQLGRPDPETRDLINQGREVLGDENVFVVPLGNYPPVHELTNRYGNALHRDPIVALSR